MWICCGVWNSTALLICLVSIFQPQNADALSVVSCQCPLSIPKALHQQALTVSSIMTTGLPTLAPELIACILDFVPSIDLQQTTISLICVLSYSSVPNWRHYLFYHVHLRTPDGVSKLVRHFKRSPGDAAYVQKFSLASWTVDAKLATEAILMLPKLKWLSFCLGVSFTPAHLGKLFRKPMPKLRYLSFRLRP